MQEVNRKLFQMFILWAFLLICPWIYGQEVPQHVSYDRIYLYLDEMASEKLISLNSVVKPYSRKFIAEKLQQLNDSSAKLNNRQKGELAFFLQDYQKELDKALPPSRMNLLRKDHYFLALNAPSFFYKDKNFSFSLKPLIGIQYFHNDSGSVKHRWVGADFSASMGSHWSAYANIRDNSFSHLLDKPDFLNNMAGGSYKITFTESDFSEMRGGLLYAWDWGSLGFIKDHFVWGDHYNGANIFSGRTPSFAHIRLQLKPTKWLEFNYIHGWLVSGVVDSSRSYFFSNSYGTLYREVYRDKYLAANMFTIVPFKNFYFSFGNSIIYSDDGVRAEYLIPFLFYKSVDHNLNEASSNSLGQNSQMFLNISSRQIKHTHLFVSVFADELNIGNMFKTKEHSNFISAKVGCNINNFPFQNLSVFAEYTATNPLAYKHFIPSTTFESGQYNLGHYLTDNSEESFFKLAYQVSKNMQISASYIRALHGPDYTTMGVDRLGLPFIDAVKWYNESWGIQLIYEVINDGFITLSYSKSNIGGPDVLLYSPTYFIGKQNTLTLGVNLGF